MASNRKKLTIGDAINAAFTRQIKSDLTFSVEGALWKVKANVAEAARQGFVGLITGAGKFASIELEVSEEFGAPECYTDAKANGYQPMRDFLALAYPGFREAQSYIEQQNKLPVDKRDAAGMSTAEAHITRSRRLIQQGLGFLYSAWKARTNPTKEAGEARTAKQFIRETVIPTLAKMAGDKSKLVAAEKREAQFWLNWISYGQEHRKPASDFLVQHTLNTLQAAAATPAKPAPVKQLAAHEVAIVNAAIDAATAKLDALAADDVGKVISE